MPLLQIYLYLDYIQISVNHYRPYRLYTSPERDGRQTEGDVIIYFLVLDLRPCTHLLYKLRIWLRMDALLAVHQPCPVLGMVKLALSENLL